MIRGGNALGPLFVIGLLLALVGLATLAVAGLRDGVMRWPAAGLFVAFLVGMALGNHGGSIVIGAAWLIVGWLVDDEVTHGRAVAVSSRG